MSLIYVHWDGQDKQDVWMLAKFWLPSSGPLRSIRRFATSLSLQEQKILSSFAINMCNCNITSKITDHARKHSFEPLMMFLRPAMRPVQVHNNKNVHREKHRDDNYTLPFEPWTSQRCLHDATFSHFDKIPACGRRTDVHNPYQVPR